jgi:hypothetical protein
VPLLLYGRKSFMTSDEDSGSQSPIEMAVFSETIRRLQAVTARSTIQDV